MLERKHAEAEGQDSASTLAETFKKSIHLHMIFVRARFTWLDNDGPAPVDVISRCGHQSSMSRSIVFSKTVFSPLRLPTLDKNSVFTVPLDVREDMPHIR